MTESFALALPAHMADEIVATAHATHTEDYARGHAAFLGWESPDLTGN